MAIGGQAVIEGVMMRSKERFAVAVRLPNGKIKVKKEASTQLPAWCTFFFIRGMVGLGYMVRDGMSAIIWSSNQQLGSNEKLTPPELFFTLVSSLILGLLLFVALPFFSAHLLRVEGIWFNFLDGLFRVALFLGYLGVVSRMKDMRLLFQYHGAEHKTIYYYETKKPISLKSVSLEEIKKCAKEHHRCGTSFLFLVLLLSIVVFSLITGPWWVRFGGRILLIPVIAGVGYELVKLADKYHDRFWMQPIIAPGLWLQKITTQEPTDRQIEVAIAALQGVVQSRSSSNQT